MSSYPITTKSFPDHPVIVNLQESGYPDGKDVKEYFCPICDEECYFYYIDVDDKIVGCDKCIRCRCVEEWDVDE